MPSRLLTEVWAQLTCGVLCLVETTVWWELWGFVETAADSFPPCVCLSVWACGFGCPFGVCVWSRSCNNLWVCDVYTFPDIFKSVALWSLCPGLWWGKLWSVSKHSRVYFQFRTLSEKEERGKKWIPGLLGWEDLLASQTPQIRFLCHVKNKLWPIIKHTILNSLSLKWSIAKSYLL